jgi:peptidyl-prolyl cis-trans isomerase A (cyclophilin A)
MMKYGIIMALILLSSSIGCISNESDGKTTAVIETNMGTIKVKLYVDEMPITTGNFIRLVNDGFYDGLTFSRVKDDFMIQGGGYYPNGTYKPSPYGTITFEAHPDVKHVDGAISMARGQEINTASNQFFICDGAQPSLDDEFLQQYGMRGYAAFGVVTEGLEVVRTIASTPHDGSLEPSPGGGKPLDDIIINSIIMI